MLRALIGFVALFAALMLLLQSLNGDPPERAGDDTQSAAGARTQPPNSQRFTPTPDPVRLLPTLRSQPTQVVVQPGDTLGRIAGRYGVTVQQIVAANQITDPNLLSVGQVLVIPAPTPGSPAPAFKIIPDSELVYGPASIDFDLPGFIERNAGYLAFYREQVDQVSLNGAQILQRIAQDYSVNPRLLLAILQRQSGWLTNPAPDEASRDYPMGLPDPARRGLYRQLAWAANNLNYGFYQWRANNVAVWLLADGSLAPVDPTINAGTAAVQHLFAQLYGRPAWESAVGEQGLAATFDNLFGYPFDLAIEPLLPPGLAQPAMQLPFEKGQVWAYTGGPHAAWGSGTPWAALDFAPPGDALGCIQSDHWVTAVADGLVVRSENGVVIQDLDGDGFEQSGWVVLYLHIESRERVQAGVYLRAGERIGHPSCEGGVSTGTHVHLARRYNGEWIPAHSAALPFVVDGWVASSSGSEYNGYLERAGQRLTAYAGRREDNAVAR
jgi:murein DD-endopeptidase MepM/ murein hydrolase activator NlpD